MFFFLHFIFEWFLHDDHIYNQSIFDDVVQNHVFFFAGHFCHGDDIDNNNKDDDYHIKYWKKSIFNVSNSGFK